MTNPKGSRPSLLGTSLVLLIGAILVGAHPTGAATTATRRVRVPIALSQSAIPNDLEPADLTVLLDQQVQRIRNIEVPLPGDDFLEDEQAWQVLVYFDAPLTTVDGMRQAARWLGREADSLSRLGPVEIVLADPAPLQLVAATRDPMAIREAAQDLLTEAQTTGGLIWHRQRFAAAQADHVESHTDHALSDEIDMIGRQRRSLLRWLANVGPSGPRLLLLVQNGYDLNPRAFYSTPTISSFLEDPRSELSQRQLSRVLSTDGWTVVCLALGPRPEEFSDPAAPLFELARATGGEVVTSRRGGSQMIERILSWPLVDVELVASPGTEALPFEIRSVRSGKRHSTRRWEAVAPLPIVAKMRSSPVEDREVERPILQLLRPAGLTFEGEVRFRAISGLHRVHHVVFFLDGTPVAETRRSPFSALIDLGSGVQPHSVAAIAYSRSDRSLGTDSLQLNTALEPPQVVIAGLEFDAEGGFLDVVATASAPDGTPPDRVEFFLNESRRATLTQAPFRVRLEATELRPTDVVRVVAHYASGITAEAARLPALAGPVDELDVNLVELLAMVTPRSHQSQIVLQSTDFIIRQRGRSLPVDRFSRWEEMQLTLGLVLDTSDSMRPILEDARSAGKRFVHQALRTGDEAFVVEFNNLPRVARRTTTDSEELLHSLVGLEASGRTALYDAIVFSLQEFENTSGRRALVVLTDGEDSSSLYQPRECVRQAKLHGVPVYLIVLGSPPDPHRNPELLRNLMVARRTGGEVYYVTDLDDLSQIYEQILGHLRHQYFLAFDAGHTLTPAELEDIEIEVVQKGITVRTLLASQHRGG